MSSRTSVPGRPIRRASSLASEDSAGANASTASFRRRREETLRKNAERDNIPKPRVATNKARTSARATSTTSSSRNVPARPSSTMTAAKLAKKPAVAVTIPEPTPPPPPPRGTVASMNPEPAVALHASAKVFEAAAYMAAKRQDAVLIVDGEGHLAGILTDKDLAYRVVANGLDPRTTAVSQAMTANPVSVTTNSNATEALNKMVAGHFRHLPVVESDDESSEDSVHVPGHAQSSAAGPSMSGSSSPGSASTSSNSGGVVGILDITKCLYEALEKLDRAYESSRRLNEALEGVEREWSIRSGSIGRYAEVLREQLACPDLAGLLASQSASPPVVGMRATILEAAQKMREHRETAVLVFDSDQQGQIGELGTLAGIFTSKDLVLRVLAAGLDPASTTVVRVMTPHPDCVTPNTPVVDALRKMHAGRYLHLPVVDGVGVVEGLVDVLKLTYTTLTQMTSIQGDPSEGPVWNRFWDSTLNPGESYPHDDVGESTSNGSDRFSQSSNHREYGDEHNFPDDSTVAPDDSASVFPSRTRHHLDHSINQAASSYAGSGVGMSTTLGSALPDHIYVFKIRDTRSTQLHRFTSPYSSLSDLQSLVAAKLSLPLASVWLSYIDDEGDYVNLSTDKDLEDAVLMARAAGWGRLVLSLDGEREGREVEALNSVAGQVLVGAERRRRRDRNGTFLTPMLMGGGIALACAFLLGRSFK